VRQAVVFAAFSLRLLRRSFDVLAVDAVPFVQVIPLWLVARVRRRPLLVTWHEVWGKAYWREYLGPAGLVGYWLESWCTRLPDAVIATSEQTAERVRQLRGRRGAADVVVVTPGVDDAELAAVQPRPDVDDIVCVGRLLAHKNVHLVVEAVHRLRAGGREVRLTIVGQGRSGSDCSPWWVVWAWTTRCTCSTRSRIGPTCWP
jgi:glycosyltransferase involved in cell wall biosynthesis